MFQLQGRFSCINERETSSAHVAENGAPPDKFGVLYLLHLEFYGFNSRIDVSGLLNFGSWYKLNFLESMGHFRIINMENN